MKEVGVTMGAWEYRMRWYGEEESVARLRGLCARPGGRQIRRRDGHGLGDG